MGIDFLDIAIRLEKRFNIKLPRGWTNDFPARRFPNDITSGDLAAMVLKLLPPDSPFRGKDDPIDQDMACIVCEYNLRGLSRLGRCPECGTPIEIEKHVWAGVCEVLVDVLGIEKEKINRDSRVFPDLGAS
jgi:hypothetical protein